ncbi:MAG: hypothetical protein FJX62_20345 [Alphaproteobacteria bacterium]|nr:hypothetical protein [Alphaproteobacteria bacterium]
MVRRRPSLGLFGIFGRAPELRQLDQTFRALDVHPRLVPEAVKLTIISLLQDHAENGKPTPQAYRAAAEIVGYCIMGPVAFATLDDDASLVTAIEERIERALEFTSTLDAKLVLLALHAGVIQKSVVEHFQLESENE